MFDISVIIPIYNVADTIERCARSLFMQTKREVEYIFINDCTLDNSVEILQSLLSSEFSELNNQVRIINLEKNSGQGTARRIGQNSASGKYIAFCDSDDWVEKNCYEKMYEATDCGITDIVVCNWFDEYKHKTVIHNEKEISINPKEALRNSYKCYFKQYLWNKLIKKEILDRYEIQMEKGINLWEDELYLDRVFLNAKSLSQVSAPLYHYNKANIKSTTREVKDVHIPQLRYVVDILSVLYDNETGFEKTKDFLRFRCRIQLLRDNWSDYNLYLNTYPDSGRYISEYDLSGFSILGKIRIKLIKLCLLRLCILLNKLKAITILLKWTNRSLNQLIL